MQTLDLKKTMKPYYLPSAKKIEVVDVPRFQFLMVDGSIEPDQKPGSSPRFAEDTGLLYGAAYTLKFMFKKRKTDPVDYPVMALEGLWWVEDGTFDIRFPGNWKYTVMILVPEIIDQAHFSEAVSQLRKKKGDMPAYARLRMELFKEGLCVQTLHIGAYSDEPATVERMQTFMGENGLKDMVGHGGKHHEIYLGDPRRGDPAKLKTVLRHPVSK